jgi:hypothetical protein
MWLLLVMYTYTGPTPMFSENMFPYDTEQTCNAVGRRMQQIAESPQLHLRYTCKYIPQGVSTTESLSP